MARRYEEPVDVSTRDATMEAFIWRGRLYAVRAVLDRWTERRSWWRDPLGAPQAGERVVWRVEASAGRCAGTGVYDLGLDNDLGSGSGLGSGSDAGVAGSGAGAAGSGVGGAASSRSWVLLRVQD